LQSSARRGNQHGSRRLFEEWVSNRSQRAFHFIYKAPFDNGLTEHELIMIGYYDEKPEINQKKMENGWILKL
jgi:isopentenyl-diphosphate delta-isomerase